MKTVDPLMYKQGLIGDQPMAFDAYCNMKSSDILIIEGYAGTGKTTVMSAIMRYMDAENKQQFILSRKNIFVGAPTHQAKKVLMRKFNVNGSNSDCTISIDTIHKGLGMKLIVTEEGEEAFVPDPQLNLFKFSDNQTEVERADVVVVEEASMVGTKLGETLMKFWAKKKFKLIIIGDGAQVPPPDSPQSYLLSEHFDKEYNPKKVILEKVIRQGEGSFVLDLATEVRKNLKMSAKAALSLVSEFLNKENDRGFIRSVDASELSKTLVPYYTSKEFGENHNLIKCLAFNVKMAEKYAFFIRSKMADHKSDRFEVGDHVIFNKPYQIPNSYQIIQNNDEFMVLKSEESTMELFGELFEVDLLTIKDLYESDEYVMIPAIANHERTRLAEVMSKRYSVISCIPRSNPSDRKAAFGMFFAERDRVANISFLYGLTVHKSQGNTYHTTMVDIMNILKISDAYVRNRLLYTSVTRSSNNLIFKL